jgi:GT2 family glycosyltransferase
MKLSVICCTKRANPHLEWAIESLNNQTFKDFEYIVVDGLYEERAGKIVDLLKEKAKFPFGYVPDKPNIWKDIGKTALASSRNTGFLMANGEHVVFHDDECKMEPNWLERHNYWAEKNVCVAGSWIGHQYSDDQGNFVTGIYGPEWRLKEHPEPFECNPAWLYGANFSVPLDAALAVNGNDELYCGQMGGEDCDFGIRLARYGYRVFFDPKCLVHYVVSPADPMSLSLKPETYSKDLEVELKQHPKERLLDDGILHFANEWLIQLLQKQKSRYWTLGNAFQLSVLRDEYEELKQRNGTLTELYQMLDLWKWPIEVDWRDGQRLVEMVEKHVNPEYTREWYLAGNCCSSEDIAKYVYSLVEPKSVIDFGCCNGIWLKNMRELGATEVLGIDAYVPKDVLVIKEDEYLDHDLNIPLKIIKRYDLAICLETVEHLKPEISRVIVAELCNAAPVVLFSAAIPNQGGTAHINEHWPEYWADRFKENGYIAIDCIRPKIKQMYPAYEKPEASIEENVPSWYAQNCLIFAKESELSKYPKLAAENFSRGRLSRAHPGYTWIKGVPDEVKSHA